MGSAASPVCGSSSPTLSLSDMCQRMQCLVACWGSEVHIELEDVTDNHEEENAKEEEEEEEEEEGNDPGGGLPYGTDGDARRKF